MGRSLQTHIQRASNTATSKNIADGWERNPEVKYVIAHKGVNDVRDGRQCDIVISNLTDLFKKLHSLFPEAKLGYSEMLYVGREESNPHINHTIKSINDQMKAYCSDNDMTFITHSSLQTGSDDLYDDEVHISRRSGTALFVSDVPRAIGPQRSKRVPVNESFLKQYRGNQLSTIR